MEQIALDAEPVDEGASPFEGGWLRRRRQEGHHALDQPRSMDVRVDELTHVGWFQRAVSSVQKTVGRLFRFKN